MNKKQYLKEPAEIKHSNSDTHNRYSLLFIVYILIYLIQYALTQDFSMLSKAKHCRNLSHSCSKIAALASWQCTTSFSWILKRMQSYEIFKCILIYHYRYVQFFPHDCYFKAECFYENVLCTSTHPLIFLADVSIVTSQNNLSISDTISRSIWHQQQLVVDINSNSNYSPSKNAYFLPITE